MQFAIYEILEKVEKAKTEEAKIDLLRKNRSRVLVDILQGAFDKRIIWLLPEGPAPYKPNEGVGVEGALYHEARKMPYFVANAGPQYELSQNKREIMFIQFLESIHPEDAELMVAVKDKKLPYPSITPELVFSKAFWDVNVLWDKESNIQEIPEKEKPAAGVVTEKPKRKRSTKRKPTSTKRKPASRKKKPTTKTTKKEEKNVKV
jgi:cell division septation protein DedD